jgi:hypothetical protein
LGHGRRFRSLGFVRLNGEALLRSAVMSAQRRFSSSHASYDMLASFSFGATVRGFVGAFTDFTGVLGGEGFVTMVLRGGVG